jgi:hypothetical protein
MKERIANFPCQRSMIHKIEPVELDLPAISSSERAGAKVS